MSESFDELEQEIRAKLLRMKEATSEWLKTLLPAITCTEHGVVRAIDAERSAHTRKAIYSECAECVFARKAHPRGVPKILLRASFSNWTCESPAAHEALSSVVHYAKSPTGFLLLLGKKGTGKSHLSVAVARTWPKDFQFVTQSQLLIRLRDSYRDQSVKSPVARAQSVPLLILDEAGLSGGGKDEMPMLHEVLCHRYNEKLPTVITSNLIVKELEPVLGERIYDRLTECTYKVITLAGKSHRRDARTRYFGQQELSPVMPPPPDKESIEPVQS